MNYFALCNLRKIKYTSISRIIACSVICLTSISTLAQTTPDTMMNHKPISINADNQQINIEQNTITFSGNVTLIQDGVTVKADTVIITEIHNKNNQVITAYGKPARFEQTVKNSEQNPITGSADQLIYKIQENSVIMTGKAELFRQDNHVSSDIITYDIEQQKIQAQSQKNNQVKTTIIPNQVSEINQ